MRIHGFGIDVLLTWIFNFDLLNKIVSKDLVVGLPKLKFSKDHLCDACQMGKQTRISFKYKNIVSTTRPLELLHMDLFGPSRIKSLGGNYYEFVIVDDYYNAMGELTWDVLCFIAIVAVSKSRHRLFFYPNKGKGEKNRKDLWDIFLS